MKEELVKEQLQIFIATTLQKYNLTLREYTIYAGYFYL